MNASPAKTQIAMPLFQTALPSSGEHIAAAWSELFPRLPPLVVSPGATRDVTSYGVDGRTVLAVYIPAPIPTNEAVMAVQSSWMWQKEPTDVIEQHAAHAIVTSAGRDPLVAATDVARVSAALLAAGSGAALYWGNSRQVHMPKTVADLSGGPTPPVPLMVGITISADAPGGPFSAATHGMEALGHKEYEVLHTRTGVGPLRMALLDLALYVLKRGPILSHGQTIGPSADAKWSVSHVPSRLVPGREVILLGIP